MAIPSTKITVYRFRMYDIRADNWTVSKRMGTRDAIDAVRGSVLEDTAVDVDEEAIDSDIPGLTETGFNPKPQRKGFQTSMSS